MRAKRKNKDKPVRASRPSAAIRVAYKQSLFKLIDKMQASVKYWVSAAYKKLYPEIAQDTASEDLAMELKKVIARWQKEFDAMGDEIAAHFAESSCKHASTALLKALKDAGYTVHFQNTKRVNDMISSIVIENVSLIRSISSEYLLEVQGLVQRSVQAGRDLGYLTDELEKRYGVTRRRAEFIARDQNNKASSAIANARYDELGITEGYWVHIPGRKTSRASHKAMDGKLYDIKKGMWDEDANKFVFPGEEPGCMCVSRPKIKLG